MESRRVGWIFLVLATLVAIEIVVQILAVRTILPQFEMKPPFYAVQHPPHPHAERLTISTAEGIALRGSVLRSADGESRGVVVFFPELDGNHWSASWYSESLYESGYDIVSFDFRGQGESDAMPGYAPMHWPTVHEVADASAVLAWVHEQPEWHDLPIGVFGISRGSLVGLLAAAEHPFVQAVCGEGTYTIDRLVEHFVYRWAQLYIPASIVALLPRWHVRSTVRLVRLISGWRRNVNYAVLEKRLTALRRMPVLLIAGERDNYVDPTVTDSIVDSISGPLCDLWLAPHAKHNQARVSHPAEYDRRLVEFFDSVAAPRPEPSEAYSAA